MNTAQAKIVIETALLCAGQPLDIADLRRLLSEHDGEGAQVPPADAIRALLDDLRHDWRDRGLELAAVASGWRFQTRPAMARWLERLHSERPPRYSRAVLETLAIIAYRQPVTRGDIEEIRGVGVSSQVIRTLEERGWVEAIGQREVPGRPTLFATTRAFLDDFALRSLDELPPLESSDPGAGPMTLELPLAVPEVVLPVIAGMPSSDDVASSVGADASSPSLDFVQSGFAEPNTGPA